METELEDYERQVIPVREYSEGEEVAFRFDPDNGRYVIVALNEGGHNSTWLDILDLLAWVQKERPDLLDMALNSNHSD